MNVNFKILGTLCLTLLLVIQVSAIGIEFQELTLNEALAKAKKENKHVFIDVYAVWCGPCKYLAQEIFPDQQLGEFMNENFVSIQLDGEKGDGLELMYKFSLDAFPTMLFLSPEMELKKKIVGVASPEDIKNSGNAVVFPETTAIYKLEKRYQSGDRTRETMIAYSVELIKEDRDAESMITEFLELYPKLTLANEMDFIIFTVGIKDRNNLYVKEFLHEAKKYKDLHGELAETKMEMIIIDLLSKAVDSNNKSMLASGVDSIYDPYKSVFGEYSLSKEKLLEALESNFDSMM